jgi:hypothetical protein
MQNIKIQNFLPFSLEQELYNVLTSSDFSWYWNEAIIHGEKEDIKDSFQFTHTFIVNNNSISNWLNLVLPIVYLLEKQLDIKIKSIHRIKANLTTKTIITKSDIKNLYHKDMDNSNYISFIYYVNNSDGDTVVDNISFTPERNSIIWFKSNTLHAGMFPKINKRRIIINGILEI